MSLTGLAEDPYLGASDGGVVLVGEDSDGDPLSVHRQHGAAQVCVGEGEDAQVQRGGGGHDVAEKTGQRSLWAVAQRADAGTGGDKVFIVTLSADLRQRDLNTVQDFFPFVQ